MQGRCQRAQDKQLPQKPLRPRRPHRQRAPMLPEGAERGVRRSHTIRGVIGERTKNRDREHERQADPPPALREVGNASLVGETRRREQASEKKHQRHQADILPGTKQIKAKPPVRIDDRERDPAIRPRIKLEWDGRLRSEVRQCRMKRDYNHDDDSTQITEWNVHARSHATAQAHGTWLEPTWRRPAGS